MNTSNIGGAGPDDGELYEPHDVNTGGKEPRLLTSKEKIQELTQLLEQRNLEQVEMQIKLQEFEPTQQHLI